MAASKPSGHKDQKPLIVIKKKKRRGGHGGGHGSTAWKIAYADFVTAMMSFFLVMWLINSMTAEDKKGMSAYFASAGTAGGESGAGGILGGETIQSEGMMEDASGAPESVANTVSQEEAKSKLTEKQLQDAEEQAQFEKAEAAIKKDLQNSPEIKNLSDNLVMDTTAQGLRIQLVDVSKKPMFQSGSSTILPDMEKLLRVVAEAVKNLPNPIKITGHTDAAQYAKKNYSNWELSSDRANATRRFLSELINGEKIQEVAGKAATEPLIVDNPNSPANRRISIVLLRSSMKKEAEKSNQPSSAPSQQSTPLPPAQGPSQTGDTPLSPGEPETPLQE